jgi:rare lipoprotein A
VRLFSAYDWPWRSAGSLLLGVAASAVLAACSKSLPTYAARSPSPASSISSSKYGVAASPRTVENDRIPKGGGTYKIGAPYQIAGRWYAPAEDPAYDRSGIASWYGAGFHGRTTANGEIFDMNALTAAHPTLPIPSYAYVTNLANGRTVMVRINDRGPYAHDRIIDLSRRTAQLLGTEARGLAQVRVRYAGRAPLDGNDRQERSYLAQQPWAGGVRLAEAW